MENSITSNLNNLVIYVTYSKKEALILKEKLTKKIENFAMKKVQENNINNTNTNEIDLDLNLEIKNQKISVEEINSNTSKFVIFCIGDNPSYTENYYLPKIALAYCNQIISNKNKIFNNNNKLNILYCLDDLSGFILAERKFYEAVKLYQSSNPFLNNLTEKCGNWSNLNDNDKDYNFSAILINEKKKLNFEFEQFAKKYNNNVFSFTDKIINFEANLNIMKSNEIINLNIKKKKIKRF